MTSSYLPDPGKMVPSDLKDKESYLGEEGDKTGDFKVVSPPAPIINVVTPGDHYDRDLDIRINALNAASLILGGRPVSEDEVIDHAKWYERYLRGDA